MSLPPDSQERIAILNPYGFYVRAGVSFVEKGRLQKAVNVSVAPISVVGITVPGGSASVVVTTSARSGGVVVEERTTYGQGRGYAVLPGLSTLSVDSYVQRPGAGGGDDTLMVLNPNRVTALVTLTALATTSAGARQVSVAAMGQLAVRLRSSDVGSNSALHVVSSAPIAVSYEGLLPPSGEASLTRTYRGSVVSNAITPARIHEFAEGDTRQLLSNPQETLYLDNTNAHPTQVTVVMLFTRSRVTTHVLMLPSDGQRAVLLNSWGPPGQHGLIVLSTRPILASRTIDFNESTDRLESSGLAG